MIIDYPIQATHTKILTNPFLFPQIVVFLYVQDEGI
jgi:hypothetical protein